jgi:hypothetical protein
VQDTNLFKLAQLQRKHLAAGLGHESLQFAEAFRATK